MIARAPAEPKPVLKGALAKEVKTLTLTLLGEKKNPSGAFEAKVQALASVPTLLVQAERIDQFLPALQLILQGISDVISGPHAAQEFAVNKAAHLAIDTIKGLLEPQSKEMELVARALLVPLLSVTDKAVQGAKDWAPKFGELAAEIAELAPPTEPLVNGLVSKLLDGSPPIIYRDNECTFAAACLGKLVRATDLEPIVQGLKRLMAHKTSSVRHQAIRSIGELATVDEAYEGAFCEAFPKLAPEIRKAVSRATSNK